MSVTRATDASLGGVALGTVQWGLPYGIANRSGQPDRDAIRAILLRARAAGVRELDTARAYGESEAVIGELVGDDPYWRIVTKLDPDTGDAASADDAVRRTEASVKTSLATLGRRRLDTLLLHVADHRQAFGGCIWKTLVDLRSAGFIGELGVSVNSPTEAFAAVEASDVEAVQVACNLLDQRLLQQGFFQRSAERGVRVYVRSVYLQGVAFLGPAELSAHLAPLGSPLAALDGIARRHGVTRPELFLRFAHAIPGATLVLGCETEQQVAANLATLASPALALDVMAEVAASIPPLGDEILTPSMWR